MNPTMRIAIHAIYYHPEVGGMESHIKDLAGEFTARGHEVSIVCGNSLPELKRTENIDGVEVTRTRWWGRNKLGWLLYVLTSLPTYLRISREADILHGQGFPCALATRKAKLRHGAPAVVTVHSSHFLKLARRKLLKPVFGWLFSSIDHMLAPSEEIATAIRSVSSHSEPECYVNSVNTNVFRRVKPTVGVNGTATIVCPRRLVEKNGVRYAIMAMPHILESAPAHLYMVGPGPLRSELEQLAQELGIAGHVTFLGSQPHERMPGILSSADVILIPSLMEATSISALEAMACECVIAASKVGGLPEIIDNEVGVLFEPGNPVDAARKVIELLGSDREEMGKAARQRVQENWSARRLADHHLAIYQRLLDTRQTPGRTPIS